VLPAEPLDRIAHELKELNRVAHTIPLLVIAPYTINEVFNVSFSVLGHRLGELAVRTYNRVFKCLLLVCLNTSKHRIIEVTTGKEALQGRVHEAARIDVLKRFHYLHYFFLSTQRSAKHDFFKHLYIVALAVLQGLNDGRRLGSKHSAIYVEQ
jgi:hypothetical protein